MNTRVRLHVGQQHSQIWPILTRFVDYYSLFWGPEAFSMVVEPKVCLCFGHPNSQFGPVLARFVDYYSLFWGPGVISTIDKPRGAFASQSSTLTVLANSDAFCGLLVIVFWS